MKKSKVISLRLTESEWTELVRITEQYNFQDHSKYVRWCVFGKKHKDQKTLLFQNAVIAIHAQVFEVNNDPNGFNQSQWTILMEKLEKLIDGDTKKLQDS